MAEDKYSGTFNDKLINFVRNYMTTFIIVGMCVFYILQGLVKIDTTGKTIAQIIGGGALSFVFGFTLKQMRGNAGILNGLKNPKFIATANEYGDSKFSIKDRVHEMPTFCDKRYEEELDKKRSSHLLDYGLSYEKFKVGEYANVKDKTIKKVLKKVYKIDAFKLTPVLIMNAYADCAQESEIMKQSIKSFKFNKLLKNLIMGILFFGLFGYFGFVSGEFDKAGMIWCGVQVLFYLGMGEIEYLSSYHFVSETIRYKVQYAITLIDEFKNTRKKEVDEKWENSISTHAQEKNCSSNAVSNI